MLELCVDFNDDARGIAAAIMKLVLDWKGGLQFANSAGSPAIELHSGTRGVTSPPEALAYAVTACMAMDILYMLEKGRHDILAMRVTFEGERAADHPRRFLSMSIHFMVTGNVDPQAIERAIELSRSTYCSVWNTLKPDVQLRTTFEVQDPPSAATQGSS